MDKRKKIMIIDIISIVVLIIIGIISTIILKYKPIPEEIDDNIFPDQQTDKIVLKAKAKGKTLKFSVSFKDIENVEFYVEKSYNEKFDDVTNVLNSNTDEIEDDLTEDLENNVEKCYYRAKAKTNENILYSNIITIQLKKSIVDEENSKDIPIDIKNDKQDNDNDSYIDIFDEYDQDNFEDNNDSETDEYEDYEEFGESYEIGDEDNTEIEEDYTEDFSKQYLYLSESELFLDINGYNIATIVATTNIQDNDKAIIWSSSNPNVATVDSNGKITAKGNGNTIITAKISNDISQNCNVNVTTSANDISIDMQSINLDILTNRSKMLTATVLPSTTVDKTVIWSSSNTNIVDVDQSGNITANTNGTAIVTAETSNGKKSTCQVNVTTSGSGIFLNKANLEIDLSKNSQFKLIATVVPADTSNKQIMWSSSNTNVLQVDSNGNVTGKSAGTAVITAKMSNGKSSNCKVTVTDKVYANKIILDKTNIKIVKDSSSTIVAKVFPENTTKKSLNFSNSNSNVVNVSISSNGIINITGKNVGTAIITIKATDGSNVSSQITVEVTRKYSNKYLNVISNGNVYYTHNSIRYRIVKSRIDLNLFIKILRDNRLWQTYADACLSYAGGYAYFLAEKTAWDFDNVIAYDLAHYKYGYFKVFNSDNKLTVLQKVYDEIYRGYPPVIHVNGNKDGTCRHYITVVGVRANASRSKLEESDFLVIDSASLKVLNKDGRYMITGYKTGRNYGWQMQYSPNKPKT